MSNESIEIRHARMEERLKMLITALEDDRDHRENQKEALRNIQISLVSIEGRVEKVEESLAKASPTIEEFVSIKHKVIGAGIMGKWVWGALGAVIGILYSARESIIATLQRG